MCEEEKVSKSGWEIRGPSHTRTYKTGNWLNNSKEC